MEQCGTFGFDVAVYADTIDVVWTYNKDSSSRSVYFYGLDRALIRKIVALDDDTGDLFEYSVGVSEDYIVEGAYGDNGGDSNNAGRVYVSSTGRDFVEKLIALVQFPRKGHS